MADVEKTIENLKRRNYSVSRFPDREAAALYLLEDIGGRSVGIGGSVTVRELDLYPRLRERGEVHWHWSDDGRAAIERANGAQVYLTSANAVSQSGQIVNIDGTGNRVMNLCYGHEKVYIIVGANKLTPDDNMALWRARNVAAPRNARRLEKNTPCVRGELRCYDCKSEERICGLFLVLERKPGGVPEMEVVIIDEALGY